MTIFWFRRDLRLDDNTGLYKALTADDNVLPIFIFDKNILDELPKDDARVTFIHNNLQNIQSILKKNDRSLAVFYDDPVKVISKLIGEHKITALYTNHDYEPYAIKRDKEIHELLSANNISFNTFKDQVMFEKNEVVKDDGSPYVVYTPYMKKWKETFKTTEIKEYNSQNKLDNITRHSYPFLTLNDIGFTESDIKPVPFNVSQPLITDYKDKRDFPFTDGTSHLSPYLRFGAISIRKVIEIAADNNNETFFNELIWREFFMQILWHFPHTVTKSFRPKYDNIKWRDNEQDFKAWCEGKTGYPIVDAGMRELNATGHMHNRVRMIVASFLCKHLLIDWRLG